MTKEIKDVYYLVLCHGMHDLKVRDGYLLLNYKTIPKYNGWRKQYCGAHGWWDVLYDYAKDKT